MGLIVCVDCRGEISSRAWCCPRCGCQLKPGTVPPEDLARRKIDLYQRVLQLIAPGPHHRDMHAFEATIDGLKIELELLAPHEIRRSGGWLLDALLNVGIEESLQVESPFPLERPEGMKPTFFDLAREMRKDLGIE